MQSKIILQFDWKNQIIRPNVFLDFLLNDISLLLKVGLNAHCRHGVISANCDE